MRHAIDLLSMSPQVAVDGNCSLTLENAMADPAFVDGDGWISDESSFYGDETVKASWEGKLERGLKRSYNSYDTEVAKRNKVKHQTKTTSKPTKDDNVLGFLKSRPQIAALQTTSSSNRRESSIAPRNSCAASGEEAADLLDSDRFRDDRAAKRRDETIREFLDRLPVADPVTAAVGPWLWVGNPDATKNRDNGASARDVVAFVEAGNHLLTSFSKRKHQIETANPEKSEATITRKVAPYRDRLEEDLLEAAIDKATTCGKWMLFPGSSDLPRYWRIVAEATSKGKLGPISKVGTYENNGKDETLVCVYTYNFYDFKDVKRVLEELLGLGLCSKDGKPVYYKCDAYTYLDIKFDNPYKMRASLYSSKIIFGNDTKAIDSGPVERLRRRRIAVGNHV